MSFPLQGEPERQAIASIGGILYQIWQSVLAWISLESSEVLYLEGAEDFDIVGPDQASAVQVKRTTTPISLGSSKAIKALGDFWRLREKNPGRKATFRYLTTSEPGVESGSPFGKDTRGLEVWENCKREREGVAQIKAFLIRRNDVNKDLRFFLENATSDQVYRELIQPIAWITGQHDTKDLQNAISDILIAHGEQYGVLPSATEAVLTRLFKEVCDSIARSRIEDRGLKRSDFLALFEQTTSVSVPRAEFWQLKLSVTALTEKHNLTAREFSFVQGPEPFNSPPGTFARIDLTESIKKTLQRSDLYLLAGSTGMGKTTLASLVSRS
jgi:hypothetical protein